MLQDDGRRGDGLCGGDCITDDNGNGICDNTEVSGCTYVSAENYNLLATWDDGTCSFGSNCPEGACFFDFNGDGGVGATDLLARIKNPMPRAGPSPIILRSDSVPPERISAKAAELAVPAIAEKERERFARGFTWKDPRGVISPG